MKSNDPLLFALRAFKFSFFIRMYCRRWTRLHQIFEHLNHHKVLKEGKSIQWCNTLRILGIKVNENPTLSTSTLLPTTSLRVLRVVDLNGIQQEIERTFLANCNNTELQDTLHTAAEDARHCTRKGHISHVCAYGASYAYTFTNVDNGAYFAN